MSGRINFNAMLAPLAGLLILVGAVIWGYLGATTDTHNFFSFMDEFYSNASTELFSIGVTILVIDGLSRGHARADERRRLILQMGSDDNTLAKEAVRLLRLLGWLENGALRRITLWKANLNEVDLRGANLDRACLESASLAGANLYQTHLQRAELNEADLRGAYMRQADLQAAAMKQVNLQGADGKQASLQRANLVGAALGGADLSEADLRRADLRWANLREVRLFEANLQGANLAGANLERASLIEARFDEKTTLPDGSPWTPDTDLTRFTDPAHPAFWRSDSEFSPAYRADA
jgi:hypothetical protein